MNGSRDNVGASTLQMLKCVKSYGCAEPHLTLGKPGFVFNFLEGYIECLRRHSDDPASHSLKNLY